MSYLSEAELQEAVILAKESLLPGTPFVTGAKGGQRVFLSKAGLDLLEENSVLRNLVARPKCP